MLQLTQHNTTQHNTTQHNTTQPQHNTTQHNTTQTQHSTAQHSTAQHSTAQHNTTQHKHCIHFEVSNNNETFFFTAVPLTKFKIDISNPNPTRTCARVTSGNTDTTNTLFIPCSPVVQGSIVKIGILNNEHRVLSIGEFLVFGTRRK